MLLDHIKSISDSQHYLARANIHYDRYLCSLDKIISALNNKISNKEMSNLILDKLQLRGNSFNENQYIQTACELTVMSDFIERENMKFSYENQVTPPKNVDFSVIVNGKNFNIEIKCTSYPEETKNPDEITLTFANRTPTSKLRQEMLDKTRDRLALAGKTVREGKNLDNTMKDFLLLTQEKVQCSNLDDINVLVVCCNDEIDMQKWRGYLFGAGGFFTKESRISHEQFDRVDFVLLTNLYNRHFRYFNDALISNHWSLDSSFNLLYPNKYSKRNHTITPTQGEKILNQLNQFFPNHNKYFEEYLKNNKDIPSNEDVNMKNILGIAWYADKFKASGIFYFRPQKLNDLSLI